MITETGNENIDACPRRATACSRSAPVANALVRPEWVVVRWVNADCKIWHSDTNAPVGYGWRPVAFASTWGGAYWKMVRLYRIRICR